MVHYVLPYAVFPIFNAMQAIDGNVEHAARSLGAKPSVIWLIVFPLTLPGPTALPARVHAHRLHHAGHPGCAVGYDDR
jgi:ABC-type Fe3+ transport system permease subunit